MTQCRRLHEKEWRRETITTLRDSTPTNPERPVDAVNYQTQLRLSMTAQAYLFLMQINRDRDPSISNRSIFVTAVSCLLALILIIGTAILISRWMQPQPPVPIEEAVREPEPPEVEAVYFQEGYSIVPPDGFELESREETEDGVIIYRFRGEERCQLTFAIIPDESIDRFTPTPTDYSETVIDSIPELSQDIDGEVAPIRDLVEGMSANIFRFYEKETYRGVRFTYLLVATEPGKKLILKIEGKHGGYHENDTDIAMPEHWLDALKTFRIVPEWEMPST